MKDNQVPLKDQTQFSSKNHALIPRLHNQARMDLLHPRDSPVAANIWHHSHAGHQDMIKQKQHLKIMGRKWHLHISKAGNAEDYDRWAGSHPASTLALSATNDLATSVCYRRPPPVRDCCWAIEKQLMRTTCFPSILGCNLAQEKNKKVQQTAFMTIQAFWLLCVSCSKTCSDPCPLPALGEPLPSVWLITLPTVNLSPLLRWNTLILARAPTCSWIKTHKSLSGVAQHMWNFWAYHEHIMQLHLKTSHQHEER